MPYISIGIPVYNSEKYLDIAITSVIHQTYQNWELILLDDGSTDKSLEIANKYASLDSRIKVISDGENKKLPVRLNELVEKSKYDYIARMDADDIMHPSRIEQQIKFLLDNPEYDIVSSGIISINADNKVLGYRKVESTLIDFRNNIFPIAHPSVVARKSWYLRNKYDESLPRAQDYELWSRAHRKDDFKAAIIPDLLLFYREEGNLSRDKILSSYKNNFLINVRYKDQISTRDFINFKAKSYIVTLLDKLDKLQHLSKIRNNKKFSTAQLNEYQKILSTFMLSVKKQH